MKKSCKKISTNAKGSFLLELLVAFAIISISMTVVVDAFLTSQRALRGATFEVEVARMLSQVLEDITREARVSGDFESVSGALHMSHIPGLNNESVSVAVEYRTAGGIIQKQVITDGIAEGFISMTSPNIEVTDFKVNVVDDTDVGGQTQVSIFVSARDRAESGIKIAIQTSFTERRY